MTIRLRDYQEQALAAEDTYRAEHLDENRLLIEMATGLGKSITLSERARRCLDSFNGVARVLILVHTDVLVNQLALDARFVAAPFTVGIVKAEQNEVDADIIVASVATLVQPGRMEQIKDIGYIIIDEAHHAPARSYVDILTHFRAMTDACADAGYTLGEGPEMPIPGTVPVLGLTATPVRSDGTGLGTVWHHLIFSRNLPWAIRHGHLVDIVPYAVRVPDVTSTVDGVLDAQLADGLAPEAVVTAWMDKVWHADGDVAARPALEPSTVLFAPLVRSAQAFEEAFRAAGVTAATIYGDMPAAQKADVLDRFRSGEITVLCNAMMMTEGVNIPRIKCVIWARPVKRTASPSLIQGVGRGARFWVGPDAPPREEQRCLLLMVTPEADAGLATAADLSDHLGEPADGKSVLQMSEEFDLGRELDAQEFERAWRGPVVVERWDAAVQASSKAWKFTDGGVPFLPTAKRGEGYVFVVEREGSWSMFSRERAAAYGRVSYGKYGVLTGGGFITRRVGPYAPDMELAMAAAEDVALDRGGDIGRLLADKGRAWRKAVPSGELQDLARRHGLARELERIMSSRAAGKAGRLSDLVDKRVASMLLDPVARRIKGEQ